MEPSLTRRQFVQSASLTTAAAVTFPSFLRAEASVEAYGTPFAHAPLPYAADALEPAMDTATVELHYGKHHAGYVRNFLNAWGDRPRPATVESVIATFDADTPSVLRNNAGGHVNHTLFWATMSHPGSANLSSCELMQAAIVTHFGSVNLFARTFRQAALSVFGSGWAWLCVDDAGALYVTTTPNQDNPLMRDIVTQPGYPILGIDVWEHAYYLRYQNRRSEFITAWFSLVDWRAVEARWKALRHLA